MFTFTKWAEVMHVLTFVSLAITSLLLVFVLTLYTLCCVLLERLATGVNQVCSAWSGLCDLTCHSPFHIHSLPFYLCSVHTHCVLSASVGKNNELLQLPSLRSQVSWLWKWWWSDSRNWSDGKKEHEVRVYWLAKTAGNNNVIITVSWRSIKPSIFTIGWIDGC